MLCMSNLILRKNCIWLYTCYNGFVIAKSLIVGASEEAGEGQKKKKKKKKNTGKSAL